MPLNFQQNISPVTRPDIKIDPTLQNPTINKLQISIMMSLRTRSWTELSSCINPLDFFANEKIFNSIKWDARLHSAMNTMLLHYCYCRHYCGIGFTCTTCNVSFQYGLNENACNEAFRLAVIVWKACSTGQLDSWHKRQLLT